MSFHAEQVFVAGDQDDDLDLDEVIEFNALPS